MKNLPIIIHWIATIIVWVIASREWGLEPFTYGILLTIITLSTVFHTIHTVKQNKNKSKNIKS